MITLIMFVVGGLLLAVGEAISLAKRTDSEMPITYYVRRFFYSKGFIGTVAIWLLWAWLGCHFLLDVDGSLPC